MACYKTRSPGYRRGPFKVDVQHTTWKVNVPYLRIGSKIKGFISVRPDYVAVRGDTGVDCPGDGHLSVTGHDTLKHSAQTYV